MKKEIKEIRTTSYILLNAHKCRACWKCVCVEKCPKQVIGRVKSLWRKYLILQNSDDCIGCKKCINLCPHGVFSKKSGLT